MLASACVVKAITGLILIKKLHLSKCPASMWVSDWVSEWVSVHTRIASKQTLTNDFQQQYVYELRTEALVRYECVCYERQTLTSTTSINVQILLWSSYGLSTWMNKWFNLLNCKFVISSYPKSKRLVHPSNPGLIKAENATFIGPTKIHQHDTPGVFVCPALIGDTRKAPWTTQNLTEN